MKSINIICGSFLPERTAGANRLAIVAKELSKNNKVNVIYLLKPGHKFNINLIPHEVTENKNIHLHPIEIEFFSKSNFISRIINETKHALLLMNKSKEVKSEINITSIPFLMLLPVSGLYCFFSKSKNILEVRDLIWKYLEFKSGFLNKILYKTLKFICQFSINRFDKVITVTESQKSEIESISSIETTCIPNGLDYKSFNELKSLGEVENNGKIEITYAGSIGYPQNLSTLLDAAKKIDNKNVIFNILGDGPEKITLEQYARNKEISNVIFHGSVNFDEIKKVYKRSNFLYAQLRDIPSLKTAEPTKIFEYASTGREIVFGVKGDASKLLDNFDSVLKVEPDNVDDLVSTINNLKYNTKISSYNIKKIEDDFIREDITKMYSEVI
ncbi:glycosyltransferase family 4 protein [Vibrio sp. Of7-15]|uniref:glycosyltransferase family 4 protein n=1 Tax=Vibrio sp. Of7-15 TaxID=2724879 RepID=UPI001EF2AB78|nr:glycosyltransferase family 4 protein [Vibrio sp. Of7-15]MCG7498505.1 glycosyltransferase family 4 protein [Vibrio sp. Of7-15]